MGGAGLRMGARVIEVACGAGYFSIFQREDGRDVHGRRDVDGVGEDGVKVVAGSATCFAGEGCGGRNEIRTGLMRDRGLAGAGVKSLGSAEPDQGDPRQRQQPNQFGNRISQRNCPSDDRLSSFRPKRRGTFEAVATKSGRRDNRRLEIPTPEMVRIGRSLKPRIMKGLSRDSWVLNWYAACQMRVVERADADGRRETCLSLVSKSSRIV